MIMTVFDKAAVWRMERRQIKKRSRKATEELYCLVKGSQT